MSKQLLESDFLTVNLGSVLKSQTQANVSKATSDSRAATVAKQTSSQRSESRNISDWSKELERRLASNKSKSAETREADYAIETEFFNEYFNKHWDTACAKQLMLIGEPLKKAIKVLGFDARVNPILAFLLDDFVKSALIRTKLLNASTFKAIYNAVAKKLIADSQFLKANIYNIIYCPDLYKKPVSEMIEYLTLQSRTLPTDSSKYTQAHLDRNKRVFLVLPEATEKVFSNRLKQIQSADVTSKSVQNMKLNSLDTVKELINAFAGSSNRGRSKVAMGASSQKELAQKLNTPEKKLAAIQFLSITTDSAEARKALNSKKFSGVSLQQLKNATVQIAKYMPSGSLTTKAADSLVSILMSM